MKFLHVFIQTIFIIASAVCVADVIVFPDENHDLSFYEVLNDIPLSEGQTKEEYRIGSEGIRGLIEGSKRGDKESSYRLGLVFLYGYSMEGEACDWFRIACIQGQGNAQEKLVSIQKNSRSALIFPDEEYNTELYQILDEMSLDVYLIKSQLRIGSEAIKKLIKKSRMGDKDSSYSLGMVFLYGYSMEDKAYDWFRIACIQGHENAQREMELLEKYFLINNDSIE